VNVRDEIQGAPMLGHPEFLQAVRHALCCLQASNWAF